MRSRANFLVVLRVVQVADFTLALTTPCGEQKREAMRVVLRFWDIINPRDFTSLA